jgi:hypothetical protein
MFLLFSAVVRLIENHSFADVAAKDRAALTAHLHYRTYHTMKIALVSESPSTVWPLLLNKFMFLLPR